MGSFSLLNSLCRLGQSERMHQSGAGGPLGYPNSLEIAGQGYVPIQREQSLALPGILRLEFGDLSAAGAERGGELDGGAATFRGWCGRLVRELADLVRKAGHAVLASGGAYCG